MNKKEKGFTLAEVLITLAIIGIVAAMTIPTLIADYQKKAWNTASTVFERKLEEALKIMNAQSSLAGYTTTETFVDELSKHIKINKICRNDNLAECFEDNILGATSALDVATGKIEAGENTDMDITSLKTARALGQQDWSTNTVGVQFANGTTAVLAYNDKNCKQDPYSNQITGMNCLAIVYDTSGFKSPNENNKDVHMLNVNISGACAFKINGVCMSKPQKITEDVTSEECHEMIDAGLIERCASELVGFGYKNYWASAVKTCGSLDKMISMEQIKTLGLYMYDNGEPHIYDGSVVWNQTKIEDFFGTGASKTSEIVVLANREDNIGGGAYIYHPDYWSQGQNWGGDKKNFYTVCVME